MRAGQMLQKTSIDQFGFSSNSIYVILRYNQLIVFSQNLKSFKVPIIWNLIVNVSNMNYYLVYLKN